MNIKMNYFKYKTRKGSVGGVFNIYQAKSGCIVLVMSDGYTILSYQQIIDLFLYVDELIDYDNESFINYYKEQIVAYETKFLKPYPNHDET